MDLFEIRKVNRQDLGYKHKMFLKEHDALQTEGSLYVLNSHLKLFL